MSWNTESFENCIEDVTYTLKIQRKEFLSQGKYPVISQEQDFINGYWNNKANLFRVVTPVVVFGDHTKVFKYVDFDFVLGADGVKILKPRDFLFPKFFFYQLQRLDLDSLGYARHYKLLKEVEIVYPGIPEQKRIVAILDEAFEGIATAKANAEKNLLNARAIYESGLESAVTGNNTRKWRECHTSGPDAAEYLKRRLAGLRAAWKRPGKYPEPDGPVDTTIDVPERWVVASPEQLALHIVDCPHSTPKWADSAA
jgi:hypothetical protein